jgi:uncharacterized protein (DUF433 family)
VSAVVIPERFRGRITSDHRKLGGKPCIRGLRIPVDLVVGLVEGGQSVAEILADYPDLTTEDISTAIDFAARVAS